MKPKISNKSGMSLVSVLLTLLLIAGFFWLVLKIMPTNPKDNSLYKEAGINTSSYKSTIDSARKIATDAAKPRQGMEQ